MENGFNLGDFRKRKRFDQKAYKLPPPTPAHVPAETNKRPLEQQPGPFSKKKRVFITPVIRPPVAPVLITRPFTALSTPQPVSIPEPPELTTSQIPDPPAMTTSQILLPDTPEQTTPPIFLPDPPPELTTPQILLPDPPSKQTTSPILLPDPPVVETLEPTLTDDSSMDQIMSSVFGDYLQQGIPSAHCQEPQVLDTVPSLFDESNDLISFLDHFEAGLAIEQQEALMDLAMPHLKKKWKTLLVTYYEPDYPYIILFEPNFGVHIPRSFGKTVIVFTNHLDLTWDKGVELRFFQVGRPPSHRVWEAYQPHMTDAYSLDSTECPRVADVYVKWLTWLDDWEMHRDDPVPWRMVGLQPWKRALEKHVQHSHEKALAHGMPSDVTLLDHI
ncbi:uncharacterized protein TNCV_684091 [Trichonephila clavipes]|nr:uncharacterized protein TNCV_684091 [Trichonephila clavipes]